MEANPKTGGEKATDHDESIPVRNDDQKDIVIDTGRGHNSKIENESSNESESSSDTEQEQIRSKSVAEIAYSELHKSQINKKVDDKYDDVIDVSPNVDDSQTSLVDKNNEKNKIVPDDLISVEITEKSEYSDNADKDVNNKNVKPKRTKKGIFISYSPDACFVERKFVVESVRQLKENNLAEDIWFDKDENTDSPCWFSSRMEAVERCKAAILFLSDSYFTCPVSMYEAKTLLERQADDRKAPKVFSVLYGVLDNTEIPKSYTHLVRHAVDLTTKHTKKSVAEKASIVVGSLMEDLDKYAQINAPPTPFIPPDPEYSGAFLKKKICQWNVHDLQEWLLLLHIKEFYRQNIAENMVDGFLLMSLTDQDMIHVLGIDSRAVRKKIMQNILQTLDKEHKSPDNWHLRARTQRPKSEVVYIIYDPTDVRLAQTFKIDIAKKGLHVIHHDGSKLGKSKEDFLQINGSTMATASSVIVLLTDAASSSPFVFNEILFADWLGKKLVTAMFCNVYTKFRPSLKAVVGECPAVDFESKMYNESLDVLVHHIRPLRRVPGIILEQSYLNKMADGLKALETLSLSKEGKIYHPLNEDIPSVFMSYHWDMQSRIDDIKQALTNCGITCWADVTMTSQRGHSSMSHRSNTTTHDPETLQTQTQRNVKAAAVVVSCITPKYLQSDNCLRDLSLADTLHKPIVPIILRFSPLEGAPPQVRKILSRYTCHDLSNDRLFRQTLPQVIYRIRKIVLKTKHPLQ